MSSIDELRNKFLDADDDDPYGTKSSSTGSGSGAARGSSSTGAGSSSRPAPYPQARSRGDSHSRSDMGQSRKASGGGGAAGSMHGGRAKGKGREPSFVERARDAPDDDGPPGRGLMDVDPDLGRGQEDADAEVDQVRAREEREAGESDVVQLMRAWQNERHAPEILPSRDVLLGRVLDAVRRQTDDVNALRTAADMSEEDHYMTMLVQTEVERMKFVVRSYVRTRLFKIEQYAAHITSNKDLQARLTEAELLYAQRYAELVVSQFRTTVLNHLPETQQGLDDEVLTMPSMITEPDKDRPVFYHAFEGIQQVLLSDGSNIEVEKNSIHMTPYKNVEQLLLRGEVELV